MPEALARRSTLHLPQGDWATVLDCLCAHFPAISREVWLDRMARGRVLDAEQQPVGAEHAYKVGLRIHYFREVPSEIVVPFVETILYADEHLVVADKPHFLPVTPSGGYVEQTLLARLVRRLGNPELVPIHRIDRLTAGLVLLSANPASRDAYQALFRDRQIDKSTKPSPRRCRRWISPCCATPAWGRPNHSFACRKWRVHQTAKPVSRCVRCRVGCVAMACTQ